MGNIPKREIKHKKKKKTVKDLLSKVLKIGLNRVYQG